MTVERAEQRLAGRLVAAAARAPRPRPAAPAAATVVIDTHAHYYPCFGAARFLDAAARNLLRGGAPGVPGHLVVASTAACDGLAALQREIGRGTGPGLWRLEAMREPECTLALHAGEPRLVLIAASQAATAEGLEVLAIGTTGTIPGGLPIHETVRLARAAAPVVVIPYGLGKWWLGRGRILRALLEADAGAGVCLGDSACRPAGAPAPAPMRRARAAGRPVLAGTDPLPIPRDACVAGSYGTRLRCAYDPEHPLASLAAGLRSPGAAAAEMFGHRRGPVAALAAQVSLRLRRGASGGGGA